MCGRPNGVLEGSEQRGIQHMMVHHCWQETERSSAILERVCWIELDCGEVRIIFECVCRAGKEDQRRGTGGF